jgi:hypothetical protein
MAWDMATYTKYMWLCDGICHVVRIPDEFEGDLWDHHDQSLALCHGLRLLTPSARVGVKTLSQTSVWGAETHVEGN